MNPTTQESVLKAAMQHRDALVAYAFALLRDWATAEDAVQDALLIVAKKWETFQPEGDVLAWTRGIVRFQALDVRRARQKETLVGEDELLAAIDQRFQEQMTEEFSERLTSMKIALESCMGKLKEAGRGMLVDFYREKVSVDALARRLHRSANGVRVELFRLRQVLRRCAERGLRIGN